MCWLHPVWGLLCAHAFILGIASDSVYYLVFCFVLSCSFLFTGLWSAVLFCVTLYHCDKQISPQGSIHFYLIWSYSAHINSYQVAGSTAQHSTAVCIASRNDGRNTLVQTFWSVFLKCWSRFQTSKHASEL